jgi:ankyrin repeat protein
MKHPILPLAILLGFAALAPAADPPPPPKLWDVMFANPTSPKRLEQLRDLIKRGADINAPLLFDRMLMEGEDPASLKPTAWPLDVVLQQGQAQMAKLLLANGAKLHGGELSKAARMENQGDSLAVIEALLRAGADVNSSHESFTALYWASAKGNEDSVRLLLAQPGLKLDQIDIDGNTALMAAAENGHVEIVDMLVNAGANVRMANKRGETATALARRGLARHQAILERQEAIISSLESSRK